MVEYKCDKCGHVANSSRDLKRHQNKKNACDKAPFKCKKCQKAFHSRSYMYSHQKSCQGKPQTVEEKDQQIESLKNALAASSGLNHEIKAKQQTINNNNVQNNNINIDTINQVTQNIVILPCGQENIDHLKNMPMEQLKEQIGFDRDPKTHIDAFKLIRLDPEHPENQNILLTERDSDKVHFYTDDKEWQEGYYLYQIRQAIYDVNKNIGDLIPYKQRQNSEYYWSHLMRGIQAHCNERNDVALKPIIDGIREPLHKATLRLMDIEPPETGESTPSPADQIDRDIKLTKILEEQRTLRMNEREKTRQSEERTKQLQLELELARLRQHIV